MGVESLLMSKISHFTYCVTVEGLNILSALAGREPVYNRCQKMSCSNVTYVCMAAWFSQTKILLNWLYTCLMLKNDPMTCRLMETKMLPQATQVENSNMRADLNTTKVNCFSKEIWPSFSDVVVSQ